MSAPVAKKRQRVTKGLGFNTAAAQDEAYKAIEAKSPVARCGSGDHVGERMLAVRKFYLNGGLKTLQGACIECQKRYRAARIQRSRAKWEGKTKEYICAEYIKKFSDGVKCCSTCKVDKKPDDFGLSIGMEDGLHNICEECCVGTSQGNGGLRDFLFMPDKDKRKYEKKPACEKCGGTDKLAVDHVLPIAKGGTDCINNKQTLCVHCNSKKCDTIDCAIAIHQLCERYRDAALPFHDTMLLSQALAARVADFKKKQFVEASVEQIKQSLADYKKKYNLGHDLVRIFGKIATLFKR